MAGRRRSFSVRCATGECTQHNHYDYYNQAEYASATERSKGWRCTRHANPEQVLSPTNPGRTAALTATTLRTKPDRWTGKTKPLGRYWLPEGATTGSGLADGPGYRAHADDFPEGTRLVITAHIELPEEPLMDTHPAVGTCAVCDREYHLTKASKVWTHNNAIRDTNSGSYGMRCGGAGQAPKEQS